MARVLRDAEIIIEDGARFLVQYAEDPTLHHERRVLRGIEAGGTEAVILTPDYDVYIMDMAVPPLASLHVLHEGSCGGVKLPDNGKRNEAYLFADSKGDPDDRQAARLLGRADKFYIEARAALPPRPQPVRRLGGKTSRADATLSSRAQSRARPWPLRRPWPRPRHLRRPQPRPRLLQRRLPRLKRGASRQATG